MERMKCKIQDLLLSLHKHNEMFRSQLAFTKTEKISEEKALKLDSPSLSISNTLMASCGVRFLNSLAGSVCRLCRSGLIGVFRKKGLRKGE